MSVRDVVQAAAGAGEDKLYVDDVFSTYVYTGNSSTQAINNGIDLDGEGGLIWGKVRNSVDNHWLIDTVRGASKVLAANSTAAQTTPGPPDWVSFNNNGFSIGASNGEINQSAQTYASWTFRKAPKFFDIVTYTGNGTTGRQISHSLGATVGCLVIKKTSAVGSWIVYHRSLGTSQYLSLSSNSGASTFSAVNTVTDNYFVSDNQNASGETYVAYLFAHDAGGFGDDGEQNVISCGVYTETDDVNDEVNLGFEPQWLMIKNATGAGDWGIFDTMRGFNHSIDRDLRANTAVAENTTFNYAFPTATGFNPPSSYFGAGTQVIYIAIRRPMKPPEAGTEVFNTVFRNASSGLPQWNSGFVTDFTITMDRTGSGNTDTVDRLRGPKRLLTNSTSAESNGSPATSWDYMDGRGSSAGSLYDGQFALMFKRAPGFMDVVCYSGSGSSPQAVSHNLTAVPEIMIVKKRDSSTNWYLYSAPLGNTKAIYLETSNAPNTSAVFWNNTSPTSTQFTVGSFPSGTGTHVAYLFATLAGVSKVGSYSGTGADLNVDCGFSAGARFILIKRTDSTGDWYIWNSLTGIVAGNDPYLLLNSATIEVTNTDYIDPLSSGFTVTSSAPAALNASGGSYIFLAIA